MADPRQPQGSPRPQRLLLWQKREAEGLIGVSLLDVYFDMKGELGSKSALQLSFFPLATYQFRLLHELKSPPIPFIAEPVWLFHCVPMASTSLMQPGGGYLLSTPCPLPLSPEPELLLFLGELALQNCCP